MATCGNPGYAQQYGDAIRQLVIPTVAPQPYAGALAPPQIPTVAPAQQGAFAAAAQANPGMAVNPGTPGAQPGVTTVPQPALTGAPKAGALAVSNAGQPNKSLIDSYGQVDSETKKNLTDHMESSGIDIPAEFNNLQSAGYITAPTADYSKQDMAGFVMEAGLRMAQAGARGDYYSNPFASLATGVLGATDAYRARAMQARQMTVNYNQMMYERSQDALKLKQAADLARLQRQSQERVAGITAQGQAQRGSVAAETLNKGRIATAQINAHARAVSDQHKPDAHGGPAYYDQNKGGWFFPDNTPEMQLDPKTGRIVQRTAPPLPKSPTAPSQLGPKDILALESKISSDADVHSATTMIPGVGGKLVPWLSATPDQKSAYTSDRARALAAAASQAQPKQNAYSKFPGRTAAATAPAAAPAAAAAQNSAPEAQSAGDEDAEDTEITQGGE